MGCGWLFRCRLAFFAVILLFEQFTSAADRGGPQPPTDVAESPARARGFPFAVTPKMLPFEERGCLVWQKVTKTGGEEKSIKGGKSSRTLHGQSEVFQSCLQITSRPLSSTPGRRETSCGISGD